MKRFLALVLVIVLVLSLAACGGKGKNSDDEIAGSDNPYVVMVTDESKLGDNAFNDACWTGCNNAAAEFGIEVYCIESENADSYADSIGEAVAMQPELVICAGSNMQNALVDIALANPEMKFAIVDASNVGDNVAGITFNEQEGSFLAGVAAAMMTESEIVSFIGGEPSITLDKFQYGFDAGVATINKNIYINNQYIGNFTDVEEAAMLTSAHETLGTDVVYHAAGAAGLGVIQSAESNGIWAIGIDLDQSHLSETAVLCSVVKKADVAVFDVIKKVYEGTFDGADVTYSIASGAMGISDNAGNLPEEVTKAIEEYTEKIAAGEIIVPYNWQTNYEYRQTLN
ncbi:MAG: BMP family ABC transporter substrate-binding protein [Firmicutes bacterium]|nr:BMP family ABC transporter substrate-binding protein [Bacillota bacterium]